MGRSGSRRGEPEPQKYLMPDRKTQRYKGNQPGWLLRYRAPGRPSIQRTFYGSYRSAVVELDRIIQEENAKGEATSANPNVSLYDYLSEWVKRYRYVDGEERPATTWKQHDGNANRYILPLLKKKRWAKKALRTFTKSDCQTLVNEFRLLNGKKPSETMRKSFALTLTMTFGAAVEDGVISVSPMAGLTKSWRPKERIPEERYTPTPQEVEVVLEAFEHSSKPWMADIYRIVMWTGMRISEGLALTLDRVDLDNRRIEIRERLTVSGGRATRDGGLKSTFSRREIPLLDDAIAPIARQRRRAVDLGSDHLLVGSGRRASRIGSSGERQRTSKPEAVGYSSVASELRAAIKQTGAEKFTVHDLRSTFAVVLISAGVDTEMVSRWLGHSSPQITRRVYSPVLQPGNMNAVVDAVQQQLDQAGQEPRKTLTNSLAVLEAAARGEAHEHLMGKARALDAKLKKQ